MLVGITAAIFLIIHFCRTASNTPKETSTTTEGKRSS